MSKCIIGIAVDYSDFRIDTQANISKDIGMEYRTIPDHPRYEASSCGKIKMKKKQSHLNPWSHKSGHLYVKLDGKSRQVHHLVLSAFGVVRPSNCECCHKDGNPKNNSLANLEWGTRLKNIMDYIKHNGSHMVKNATKVDVARKIKEEHDGKRGTGKMLAEKYGVSVYTVSEIRTGKTFKYL